MLEEGELSIGRDPTNSVVLSGRGVSRRHAKVSAHGGRITVVDVGSTYGTRVNEMPTLRRELQLGDVLKIGMHAIEVRRARSGNTANLPLVLDESAPFFPDEVTHDPKAERERRRVSTAASRNRQLDSESVQFIVDEEKERSVEILAPETGEILAAVERLERRRPETGDIALSSTIAPRSADYHALLLMYRVSQLLAEAPHLEDFLASVADMVMEEVRASTVVVLLGDDEGELEPRVIRHRGALDPGEVPVSTSILQLVRKERSPVISSDVLSDERFRQAQSLALYSIRHPRRPQSRAQRRSPAALARSLSGCPLSAQSGRSRVF